MTSELDKFKERLGRMPDARFRQEAETLDALQKRYGSNAAVSAMAEAMLEEARLRKVEMAELARQNEDAYRRPDDPEPAA